MNNEPIINSLPGTPAQVADKTGVCRLTVQKRLQRLFKDDKVCRDAKGVYSVLAKPEAKSASASLPQQKPVINPILAPREPTEVLNVLRDYISPENRVNRRASEFSATQMRWQNF
jgi:hypothetical protein